MAISSQRHEMSCSEEYDALPAYVYDLLDEAVFSSREPQEALQFVLETAIDLLKAECGTLRILNQRTQTLEVKASQPCITPFSCSGKHQDLALHDDSLIAQVARTKEIVVTSNPSQEQYGEPVASSALGPELAVPILSSDGLATVGVLHVARTTTQAFTSQDQHWLILLARRARMAMQRMCLSGAIRAFSAKVLTMDKEALFDEAVHVLSDLLHAPVCSLWLLERDQLCLKSTVGRPLSAANMHLDCNSFIGQVLRIGKSVSSANILREWRFVGRDFALAQGWKAALAVPILSADGDPQGVIAVYSKETREFTRHDRNLAISLANHVAISLRQALLLDEKERHAKIISGLQTVLNDAFSSSPDLPCVYNSIVDLAVQSLDAAGGMLCLDMDGLGQPVVAAAVGVAATLYEETSSQHSLAHWVMSHQTSVLCSANDSRLNQEFVQRIGVKDVAATPLALNDSIIGSLIVMDKEHGRSSFDEVDLSLLNVLAKQATTALHQIHQNRQRQRRSWQLRVVNQILSLSLSTTDVDSLLYDAVRIISQDFHYLSSIGVIEGDKLISKATVGHNAEMMTVPLIQPLYQSPYPSIAGKVAVSGQSSFVSDVSREPCYHQLGDKTKSELAVPLIDSNTTTIGVLNIESQVLGDFSQEDVPIFEAIAVAITHAIEHARRLRQLTAFQRIATAIGQDRTLDDILHNTVDEVRALFHASVGAVFLADREARQLTLAYHNTYPDAVVSGHDHSVGHP